jgi:hypothetical protein
LQSDAKEAEDPGAVVVPGGQVWHAVPDPFTTVPKVPCKSKSETKSNLFIANPWSTSTKNVSQMFTSRDTATAKGRT